MTTLSNSVSLYFALSLLILSPFYITLSQSAELCNPIDKNALLQIKAQLGPNADLFSSWQPNTDCCRSWSNVGCNNRTNRVNYLTIGGPTPEMNGQIPPIIGDLTGLEVLYFNDMPGLTGPIPSTISKLINLQDLEFFRTNLSGSIPDSLSQLKNLEILEITQNRITGPIPSSLSQLTKLQGLRLYKNQLSGSIPASFSSFKNLAFQAYENNLSGPIPKSLSQAGFNWIDLNNNRLTGDASFLFGANKNKLVLINLSNNAFSFDFSKVGFSTKLRGLDISKNMIYGSLPQQLATLPLELFNVSYNRLCGPIPTGKWVTRFGSDAFANNRCLCGTPLAPCKN